MQNSPFMFGPLFLTTTYTTNILNPGTTTGGVNGAGSGSLYIVINHFRIGNKGAVSATFRLYKDATGGNTAGKELLGYDASIAANDSKDFYGKWLFKVADFLVGGSNTATALTIEGEGEIGLIP